MKITERRIVKQEWDETETTKTGWDSFGWQFRGDGHLVEDNWTVVEILNSDKHGNPILGIAEREVEV